MYSIEKTAYGFKLTFGGFIDAKEMALWQNEMISKLPRLNSKFGILIDMRSLKPLPSDSQEIMVKGQQACRQAGMERSAVVLDNTTTTIQFKRLAKESGINTLERYIDASANPQWETKGVKWITDAVEPE